jgi:hypothetical protein
MDKKTMIEKLTQHELVFLLENPDQLSEVTKFFTNGGFFENMSIEELKEYMNHFFESEVNHG